MGKEHIGLTCATTRRPGENVLGSSLTRSCRTSECFAVGAIHTRPLEAEALFTKLRGRGWPRPILVGFAMIWPMLWQLQEASSQWSSDVLFFQGWQSAAIISELARPRILDRGGTERSFLVILRLFWGFALWSLPLENYNLGFGSFSLFGWIRTSLPKQKIRFFYVDLWQFSSCGVLGSTFLSQGANYMSFGICVSLFSRDSRGADLSCRQLGNCWINGRNWVLLFIGNRFRRSSIYKSMVAAAMFLGWRRFAGCLVLAMEGITRIGEVLRATRGELLLPRDLFDPDSQTAFLQVRKPKTARRGKGRVQHCSVRGDLAVKFLDAIFGSLEPFLKLYPLSANSFRTKWTKLLLLLRIPKHLHPTPASVRGGGSSWHIAVANRYKASCGECDWCRRVL